MNKKTVGNLIAAAVVCMTGTHAVADVATDMITSEAVFWFDASALTAAAGTELDSWADVRGGSYPTFTTYTTIKPQVIEIADGPLAGKKAVTFFAVGTVCDMRFASEQAIKTAFFVTDIDQSNNAYLLGSDTNYNFARGSSGHGTTASYQYDISALSGTEYWNDGVKIAAPTTTVIPTGYQLITWHKASGGSVRNMCKDRTISSRIGGGKRLCEVVAFNRTLSDEERSAVEGYLKAKWWGTMSQATATFAMRVHKFGRPQVHFDASEASSFHYDVDGDTTGTKVSQWDDLSGNGRHLVPYQFDDSNPMYATRDIIHYAPALNLGSNDSGIDMKLPARLTTTRAVFMVAEVDRHRYAYWLGDATTYHFARNDATTEGAYARDNALINSKGSIYRNGQKIASPTTQYPDAPGGFNVYTFNVTQNCNWEYLCRDRDGGVNNSGGKRIAELITFDTTFADADRECLEKLLMEKWRPSEAYVDALIAAAPVHVDSASSNNFNYTGNVITGWKNSGTGADLYKPNDLYDKNTRVTCNAGSYGVTNGVPAFLMGRTGSRIDMSFERLTNVRSVFWVMDIERDTDAFFLGDGKNEVVTNPNKYDFCRGCYNAAERGCYFSPTYIADAFKYGPLFRDGMLVVSPTGERPPRGLHVFDLALQSAFTASALSKDRSIAGRDGGRALSELLIFTNAVSGLTQDMIRNRLEHKWTRSCGWAGAGDVEWGADKYRVFDADAAVPAEGASAKGVGFTESATLSGTGTLTLGDGGVFASEDTTATVSAPVAGKLGAYGPGTVNIATAPSVADSISVGYGSTLVVAAGDITVSGSLSIQENGRIVLDVSNLAPNAHASISFDGVILPAGGTIYDYITTSVADGYILMLSPDGKTLHINDPDVAVTAEWNATTSADAATAANWTCRNAAGTVILPAVLPGVHTTNVTLNADCDLRAWGTPAFANGVNIDLHGYNLQVADLSDAGYTNAVVRNSDSSVTSELHVEVANGKTATNKSIFIGGNVKVVKDGLGTFIAAKSEQTYSGGTLVKEGTLEVASGVKDARVHALGASGSVITVSTNGANVGVFKMNALYAQAAVGYVEVLDGGILRNDTSVSDASGQLGLLTLTADSKWIINGNCGFFDNHEIPSVLDLGGHTLRVEAAANRHLMLGGTTISNGVIDVKVVGAGGALLFGGGNNAIKSIPIIATNNVTIKMDCAIAMDLNSGVEVKVGNYHAIYEGAYNNGTNPFQVYGTFKPSAHNCFFGATMMDGSTIDFSSRTNALPVVSSFTTGDNTLKFADSATVTIDLSGHPNFKSFKNGYLIEWNEKPSAKFVLDAQTKQRSYRAVKTNEGLKLISGGMVIIVK